MIVSPLAFSNSFQKKFKAVSTIVLFFLSVANAYSRGADTSYTITLKDKAIIVGAKNNPIITIDSISFNYIAPSSQSLIFNNGDSTVVELQYLQIPEFNMINGSLDHNVKLIITRKNGSFHFFANTGWAGNFTLHLTDHNDHFFGLAEGLFTDNRKSPDLRGKIIDVEVNGNQYRIQENFTSIWSAFYYNPKGYASFINTFAKGRYQLAVNGQTQIEHEAGTLDWYIFTGTYNKIYQEYYNVIGKPKFVPLWACGPMVWRDEIHNGSKELLNDALEFSKLHIPLTSFMIDRPYSNGAHLWSKMDFNKGFLNPGRWIRELDSLYGLKLITWIAPATFEDKDFPGLLPGSFSYLDLSNPKAVTELGNRLKNYQYAFGVKGHKMDRADENFPQEEAWQDGTPEPQRKNKYVYLYAKVIDSLLHNAWDKDHINYARAAMHGCQQFLTGVWGGDPRTSWDGMAANMANAIRASFMGFPNWGTDVGGYLGPTGKIPDSLYIRWLQWGAFNGLFEIKIDGAGGGGEDRAPWHCSLAVQEAFRKACSTRMLLLPHIFSQLNSSAKYGPLMKPLAMVYPDDADTYPIWDEYIFGNSLLIAPVFSEYAKRNVYLPEGEWLDFYSYKKINGEQTVTVDAPLHQILIFIKSNSFIVTGNIYQGNGTSGRAAGARPYVDISFYPGTGDASFDFIDPQQENKAIIFSASSNGKDIKLSIPAISYAGLVKIISDKKPASVMKNGKKIKIAYKDHLVLIKRLANEKLAIEITL